MENENGSPISFFCCKEKRKTKIKFAFHFPIQLRYTDFLGFLDYQGEPQITN